LGESFRVNPLTKYHAIPGSEKQRRDRIWRGMDTDTGFGSDASIFSDIFLISTIPRSWGPVNTDPSSSLPSLSSETLNISQFQTLNEQQ